MIAGELKFCEWRDGWGFRCHSRAKWLVGVDARKSDRQLSCSIHLAKIFIGMLEAEKPRSAALTVVPALEQEVSK